MKKFALVFSLLSALASPVTFASHANCDCSEQCSHDCENGHGENCKCKECDCAKDKSKKCNKKTCHRDHKAAAEAEKK